MKSFEIGNIVKFTNTGELCVILEYYTQDDSFEWFKFLSMETNEIFDYNVFCKDYYFEILQ